MWSNQNVEVTQWIFALNFDIFRHASFVGAYDAAARDELTFL